MTKTLSLSALVAVPLLALAACNSKKAPEVIDTNPDPMASVLANAAPVELPPSIKATVTFRCHDNSLVYVDFFSGNTLAHLRTERGGENVNLTADKDGDPLTGAGYTLKGDPQSIALTRPGQAEQTCNA